MTRKYSHLLFLRWLYRWLEMCTPPAPVQIHSAQTNKFKNRSLIIFSFVIRISIKFRLSFLTKFEIPFLNYWFFINAIHPDSDVPIMFSCLILIDFDMLNWYFHGKHQQALTHKINKLIPCRICVRLFSQTSDPLIANTASFLKPPVNRIDILNYLLWFSNNSNKPINVNSLWRTETYFCIKYSYISCARELHISDESFILISFSALKSKSKNN